VSCSSLDSVKSSKPEVWHLLGMVVQDLEKTHGEYGPDDLNFTYAYPEAEDYAQIYTRCFKKSVALGLDVGCPMWESYVSLSFIGEKVSEIDQTLASTVSTKKTPGRKVNTVGEGAVVKKKTTTTTTAAKAKGENCPICRLRKFDDFSCL
jgi:hypothetical protein